MALSRFDLLLLEEAAEATLHLLEVRARARVGARVRSKVSVRIGIGVRVRVMVRGTLVAPSLSVICLRSVCFAQPKRFALATWIARTAKSFCRQSSSRLRATAYAPAEP